MNVLLENIGWAGAGLIVLGYFLISTKRLPAEGWKFHTINLFGAVGVGISSYVTSNWPSVALQVVWAVIASYGLALFVRSGR